MKKFIAILTALTMLLALCTVPAMADAIPGGKYANPLVKEDIVFSGTDTNSSSVLNGSAITITPNKEFTKYETKNVSYSMNVQNLEWKNTGAVEVGFDLTYDGTVNSTDFFRLNLGLKLFDSSNSRQWFTSAPDSVDFAASNVDVGTKNIKWVIEWTDTQVIAKHYNKRPEETNWTYVRTVIKDWQPSVQNRKLGDIYLYGQFNYFNGKTPVNSISATVENFYLKEIYPTTYLSVPEDVFDATSQDADIEYTLNENYKKAVLTVGGVVAEELNCDTTPSGSYVTSFDLSELTYTGTTPVELTVTDKNGNVTKKTSSITTARPKDRKLVAYTDFDGNMSETTAETYALNITSADVITSSGKTGAGVAISNRPADADGLNYKYVGLNPNNGQPAGYQSSAYINALLDDTDEYCYDFEFDVMAVGAGGKIGINYKGYVDGNATFNTDPDNPTSSKAWNWIVDKKKVAGIANKFELDGWHSMRFVVDQKANTVTTYYDEEKVATTEYITDGCYYIGVGYAVYGNNGNEAGVKIDNVKCYRYIPGTHPGVEAVSADALTKAVTVTLDTAFDAAAVDSGVTLKVGDSAVAATVAPQADDKTLVITPDIADTLKGKTAIVAIDASVVGTAMEIPVTFPDDYFNRKITENASTNAVTASADVVSYEAGTDAGIMYLAFYKNGNLVEVSKKDLATTTVGVENLSHTYTPAEAYDNIRVFIWDAYKNPLLKN